MQHLIPTYRSTDLVHWRYTGDAFTTRPSWVAADAGLWAPEIQHRGGRWYLYYTAPDTSGPGGGSAIGVATSASPTGPWTDSGGPVVAPADNPTAPGERRWTFDPEVLTVGGTRYLYFGSYFGGLFVRRLTADGLRTLPASERRIAIANRYEGANVVRHGGWYYLLASATNCCAGPLTGYSVFAARSRSPLGPFRDADGRSVLAAKVGGTPVLSQNGNRWVGAGHDSVLTDRAGQDWIVYHAVDRTDPYVTGTTDYTKRAALLDPLDWRHGWPVVRGGRGPSDSTQPAPAAQPGQRDGSRTAASSPRRGPARRSPRCRTSSAARRCLGRWTWVRRPAAGDSRWPAARCAGRRRPPTCTRRRPRSPACSASRRRAATSPSRPSCARPCRTPATRHNSVQGGLLVYGDDGHYVKLAASSIFETRQTEFGLQDSSQPAGSPTYGNGVVGPVGATWTWLRITKHTVRGATPTRRRRASTGGTGARAAPGRPTSAPPRASGSSRWAARGSRRCSTRWRSRRRADPRRRPHWGGSAGLLPGVEGGADGRAVDGLAQVPAVAERAARTPSRTLGAVNMPPDYESGTVAAGRRADAGPDGDGEGGELGARLARGSRRRPRRPPPRRR